VDEDRFCDGRDGMIIPDTYGGILIRELYPGNYKPGWARSSYLTVDWDPVNHKERRTTYRLDPKNSSGNNRESALQLFHVCRQVYEEAAFIFYLRNRFYVDTIDSLVPFLQDRPAQTRGLIDTVSIPVSYGSQQDVRGEKIPRHCNVKESSFASTCAYLSNHTEFLANVKHLDLRVWDFYGEEQYNLIGALDLDTVKISAQRAEQLASIAEPEVMILSFFDWHDAAMAGPEGMPVFEALPDNIFRKIKRLREDRLLVEHDPKLDSDEEDDDDSEDRDDGLQQGMTAAMLLRPY